MSDLRERAASATAAAEIMVSKLIAEGYSGRQLAVLAFLEGRNSGLDCAIALHAGSETKGGDST
jgi:hypothetical protein